MSRDDVMKNQYELSKKIGKCRIAWDNITLSIYFQDESVPVTIFRLVENVMDKTSIVKWETMDGLYTGAFNV